MKQKLISISGFLLSLVLFVWLAYSVMNGYTMHFDEAWSTKIQMLNNPSLTGITLFIRYAGEWFVYAPIALIFLIVPRSRVKIGIPVNVTLFVGTALNVALKLLVLAILPDVPRFVAKTGFGFPSGHAMTGIVFIGMCVFLLIRYSQKRQLKIIITILSVIYMLAMGFSLIYLSIHTPTDVFGGYLGGILVLCAAIYVYQNRRLKSDQLKRSS